MKFQVDNVEVYDLSDVRKKVICNDINRDVIVDDLKRRVKYIIEHKYDQCLERLRKEWMPKLKSRMETVPTDDDAFATLVFSQTDYKDRKDREDEPE